MSSVPPSRNRIVRLEGLAKWTTVMSGGFGAYDQQVAGGTVGDLVRDASEHKTRRVAHAPVSNHEQVRPMAPTIMAGHISCSGIGQLELFAFASSLGGQSRARLRNLLAHPVDLVLAYAETGESQPERQMGHLNGVQLRRGYLRKLESVSVGDRRPFGTVPADDNRFVHATRPASKRHGGTRVPEDSRTVSTTAAGLHRWRRNPRQRDRFLGQA